MSQALEILEFFDPAGQVLAQRIPQEDSAELKLGAQLIVRENQSAIFFRDGKALDTFGPGRHTLSTLNLPFLTKALSLPFGFESPFKAEVVFVGRQVFSNQKWGTMEPILFRDDDLSMVRLRAFGMFAFRIQNPQIFVNTLAGTAATVMVEDQSAFFRNLIVSDFADYLGENHSSVIDLPRFYNELAAGTLARTQLEVARYGIYLTDLKVNGISVPTDVQNLIDKKSGISALGDMDSFLRLQTGVALEKAAGSGSLNGENLLGAGLGLGAGFGMGAGLASFMNRAMAEPGGGGPANNSSAVTRCSSCGGPLHSEFVFCPACGSPRTIESKPCISCSKPMPPKARFCPNCGEEQISSP